MVSFLTFFLHFPQAFPAFVAAFTSLKEPAPFSTAFATSPSRISITGTDHLMGIHMSAPGTGQNIHESLTHYPAYKGFWDHLQKAGIFSDYCQRLPLPLPVPLQTSQGTAWYQIFFGICRIINIMYQTCHILLMLQSLFQNSLRAGKIRLWPVNGVKHNLFPIILQILDKSIASSRSS